MVEFRGRILRLSALFALAALFAASNSKTHAQGMNSPTPAAAAPAAPPDKEAVAPKNNAKRRSRRNSDDSAAAEGQRYAPASSIIVAPGLGGVGISIGR